VIVSFGWNYSSTLADWRFHPGVDLQAAEGAAVRAALGGLVTKVDDSFERGVHCVIDHGGGIVTVYGSLKTCAVQAGQSVSRGQIIGTVGNSCPAEVALGPHLHFELLDGTQAIDPSSYWPNP
jgi:murein DD-endopeptidase MepM/ murein hydrolase activator NlpD